MARKPWNEMDGKHGVSLAAIFPTPAPLGGASRPGRIASGVIQALALHDMQAQVPLMTINVSFSNSGMICNYHIPGFSEMGAGRVAS